MDQRLYKGTNTKDASARNVLADRQILARILQGCVLEFKDTPLDLIGDHCIEEVTVDTESVHRTEKITGEDSVDKTSDEGTVTYDIKFTAIAPKDNQKIDLTINVEVQDDYRPKDGTGDSYELVTRAVYYVSRLISSQKDTIFSGSSYQKIRKVYSIWICLDPDAGHRNTITKYELGEHFLKGEVVRKKADYDKICIVMICLRGIKDPSSIQRDIVDFLSVVFSDMKRNEKQKVLSDVFGFEPDEGFRKEMNEMFEYGAYMERQGEKKGRAAGMEIGQRIGEQIGQQIGQEKGINSTIALFATLKDRGLPEEMERAIQDPAYARELIEKFGL